LIRNEKTVTTDIQKISLQACKSFEVALNQMNSDTRPEYLILTGNLVHQHAELYHDRRLVEKWNEWAEKKFEAALSCKTTTIIIVVKIIHSWISLMKNNQNDICQNCRIEI